MASRNGQTHILITPGCTLTMANPEVYQLRVLEMMHSRDCQIRENRAKAAGQPFHCHNAECSKMKGFLNHVNRCKGNKKCPGQICKYIRNLLLHWKACREMDCEFCAPIKQYYKLLNPRVQPSFASGQISGPWYNETVVFGPRPSEVLTPDVLGQFKLNLIRKFWFETTTTVPSEQLATVQSESVAPRPSRSTAPRYGRNDWRRDVTTRRRECFVYGLIHVGFPFPNIDKLFDDRVSEVERNARRIEQEVFERATSKAEYAQIITQKCIDLQADFSEMYLV